jgi:hypothetical protein
MARMLGAPGQKELQQMNNLIVPIISLCVVAGAVLADTPRPSQEQTVVNAIKNLEEPTSTRSVNSTPPTSRLSDVRQGRHREGCFEQLRFLP